jgi:release factor glutamine methyltransferase
MGLKFKVAPCVFIPRPETEVLVETAIKQLSALSYKLSALNILDLGTGSGNIAVSLAKFLPQAEIYATDICNDALKIAKINAQLNNVENRIKFIQSDLFTAYSLQPIAYSLIISNPPYITATEIDELQPEIQYEPRLALDGGKDGLEFYRKIISLSPYYLKKDGLLIMEMGFNQAGAIRNIFKISGKFEIIGVVKDYNNIDRVMVARKVGRNG